MMCRVALLDHERLADRDVVDERDLLAARRRVVHAADDRVALLREQCGDDRVEAGVLELGLDAHRAATAVPMSMSEPTAFVPWYDSSGGYVMSLQKTIFPALT